MSLGKREGRKGRTYLPIGAPRPLDMHSETVSKGRHSSSNSIPVFATTSHILAPSQCIITPSSLIFSEMRMISSWGKIVPERVFSSATILVGAP